MPSGRYASREARGNSFREKSSDPRSNSINVGKLTFPNCQDLPAQRPKASFVAGITLPCPFKFWKPILTVGFRHMSDAAPPMIVPETAMNKNHFPQTYEHQVRMPRQLVSVQAEPIAQLMHQTAHYNFRRSVPAANLPHVGRSLFRTQVVHATPPKIISTAVNLTRALENTSASPSFICYGGLH